MTIWKRGDLVELDGKLGVVVGVAGDANVPDEHLAVWFGNSHGALGGRRHEVWTVPEEYFIAAQEPVYKH